MIDIFFTLLCVFTLTGDDKMYFVKVDYVLFPSRAAWLNNKINTNMFSSTIQHHIYLSIAF